MRSNRERARSTASFGGVAGIELAATELAGTDRVGRFGTVVVALGKRAANDEPLVPQAPAITANASADPITLARTSI